LFFEENIEKNVRLVDRLGEIAQEKQTTVSRLANAWLLAKGEDIISLIGASKLPHFQEAIPALNIRLSENDIKKIEEAIPEHEIAGAGFPQMQFRNGIVVNQ
jgi:aryl-alcohol dehydrogenase-like predicted oxidoreductase